jgi:hypothetical protein
MDLSKLKDCFEPNDIEWRLQQCGKGSNGKIWGMALAYVTNRAIMNRLDEVCGPENWKNEFKAAPDGGILCGISIKVGDEWVTKWDGAENTDIEAVKGGLSGAMKRAAVQWGIGRYLYKLEESWINANENGAYRGKTKDGTTFRWDAPTLPAWALPKGSKSETHSETKPNAEPKQTKRNVIQFTDEQKAEMSRWNDGTFSKDELDKFKKQTTAPGADINGLVQWYAAEYANRHADKVTAEEENGAELAFGEDPLNN